MYLVLQKTEENLDFKLTQVLLDKLTNLFLKHAKEQNIYLFLIVYQIRDKNIEFIFVYKSSDNEKIQENYFFKV